MKWVRAIAADALQAFADLAAWVDTRLADSLNGADDE